MPVWWVSEPNINLRLEDDPLGAYQPARGPAVAFRLSYRQRGSIPEDPNLFSVGTNWSCSFRAFLLDLSGSSGIMRLHRGGAGWIDYSNGVPLYRDGSLLTTPNGGATWQIERRDGSVAVFGQPWTNAAGFRFLFLTSQSDAPGHAVTYNYALAGANTLLLTQVVDADGNANQIYYENSTFSNQITRVVDPYGRTSVLGYSDSGALSTIVDAIGLTNSLSYDAGNPGWITNLTTPYGATGFAFGGVDAHVPIYTDGGGVVDRFVQVTLPNGGQHLYLYRQDCSTLVPAMDNQPPTGPFANTLDNVDHCYRNSFHWGPLQCSLLSTGDPASLNSSDYALGRMRHWLMTDPFTGNTADTLSLERAPTPDGVTPGLMTWYDYPGKVFGNNYAGSSGLPSMVAVLLPGSPTNSWYRNLIWNGHGNLSQEIEACTGTDGTVGWRANTYYYAANNIDLLQQVGPLGEQVVSNYFSAGNVFHQPDGSYDASNQATYYTYSPDRLVTSVTRPSGLTSTNIYYTSGAWLNRLACTVDLQINRTNYYTYANDVMATHTDARGLTTSMTWDALHRLVSTSYPDGTSTVNVYSKLDLAAKQDRLGKWTYYAYDSVRNKVMEVNANNVTNLYSYCNCGNLLAVTNAWGTSAQMVVLYSYDNQGRPYTTVLPDLTITNTWNSLGQLVQYGDGWTTHWMTYNQQGLRTSTADPEGLLQNIVYDLNDRPVFVTDANLVTVTNTYDPLGRLRGRAYPDGGVESFGYSSAGLVSYTNQLGLSKNYALDAAGRKVIETNANGLVLRYTNSSAGDLLSFTDGKGQTKVWSYDAYGRLTNETDVAGGGSHKYTYDANGRLASRWSPARGYTYYTNDSMGNLLVVKYPVSPKVTFGYDAMNRLISMVDASGTNTYSYTPGGRLWTESSPFATATITNSYVNGKRLGFSLQQAYSVWTNAFAYDAGGRLSRVTSPAGAFGYVYFGSSASVLPFGLSLPNNSYITNTYDVMARLTGTYLVTSAGTVLDSAAYGYDPAGQRTSFIDQTGTTTSYLYDNIGQLLVADSTASGRDSGYAYDAAGNLNWLTNSLGTGQFQVDTRNELTNWPTGPCAYDADGNLTNKTVASGGRVWSYAYDDEGRLIQVADNVGHSFLTSFVYDGVGRLRQRLEYSWVTNSTIGVSQVTTTSATTTTTQSVTTQSTASPGQSATSPGQSGTSPGLSGTTPGQSGTSPGRSNSPTTQSTTTSTQSSAIQPASSSSTSSGSWQLATNIWYLYDGKRVIQERNSSNTPLVSYTRGNDLGGALEKAGGVGGLLARSQGYSGGRWNSHAYYHADGNGNITYLETSSEGLGASYAYDPYGNLYSSSGSLATANVYRFSSKEFHVNSGMYYYLYRFYDPQLQRWINRDPVGERGFELLQLRNDNLMRVRDLLRRLQVGNAYEFVGNQPTGLYDMLGLEAGSPTGPPTGPNSLACIAAREQAWAALELAISEPCPENDAKAIWALQVAMAACKEPPPPQDPPWCPEKKWTPPYTPPPSPTVQKTCIWVTIGVVTYWVCSEGSRILFPPRNLIPIP